MVVTSNQKTWKYAYLAASGRSLDPFGFCTLYCAVDFIVNTIFAQW